MAGVSMTGLRLTRLLAVLVCMWMPMWPRCCTAVVITTYTRQDSTSCGADDVPSSWTSFTSSTAASFSRVAVTSKFPPTLTPIDGFAMPFYQYPASSTLYVDPDGFVSLSQVSMCPPNSGFCAGPSDGWYKFSTQISGTTGGGNWPMIGVYVSGVDPFLAGAPTNGSVWQWVSSDGTHAIIDYRNMRQWASTSSQLSTALNSVFNGQLHLYSNGTFIFKYKSYFGQIVVNGYDYYYPSVGVLGVGTLRTYGSIPTTSNAICASRFDPVFDSCAALTGSCAQCVTSGKCGWCFTTGSCTSLGPTTTELCESAETATNMTACSTRSASQTFYTSSILLGASSVLGAVTSASDYVAATDEYALKADLTAGTLTDVPVALRVAVAENATKSRGDRRDRTGERQLVLR